ncbi:MAG: hypothetical protein ACR2H4_11555 [Pyrinomonadaceae bacterium]
MNYSLASYRSIIKQALASGYTFRSFVDEERELSRRIYLRHDIDYSPSMALELARVNADLGVAGTFFALLHSHSYNLMCASAQRIVKEIHSLGQHIGLHAAVPTTTDAEVEGKLRNDFQFVQSYLPMIQPVFSWHNPTAEVLERYLTSDIFAGLINAYGARFTRNILYASDSNMRYSADHFLILFNDATCEALQLLLHPINWVAGGSNMSEVFAGGWPYLIRETEQEMRGNLCYQTMFPSGLPYKLLQSFADQWWRLARENERR